MLGYNVHSDVHSDVQDDVHGVHSDQEECISMTMSGLKLIDRIRKKQTTKAEQILKEYL